MRHIIYKIILCMCFYITTYANSYTLPHEETEKANNQDTIESLLTKKFALPKGVKIGEKIVLPARPEQGEFVLVSINQTHVPQSFITTHKHDHIKVEVTLEQQKKFLGMLIATKYVIYKYISSLSEECEKIEQGQPAYWPAKKTWPLVAAAFCVVMIGAVASVEQFFNFCYPKGS